MRPSNPDPAFADRTALATNPQRTTGLLRLLGAQLSERYAAGLVAAGYTNLTPAQTQLFPLIGAEGARITDIAERARIAKQGVQVTVDQLEANGYVERVADPFDRRAKLVRLTEHGWNAFFAINRIVDDIDRELVGALGEQKMRDLRETVTDAVRALQSSADPPARRRSPSKRPRSNRKPTRPPDDGKS